MLTILSAAVALLVIGFVARVLTRPDSFRVERSAVISAPADRIYPLLTDFHQWPRWSPWEKLDPAMQRNFSGANEGPGAVYAWSGNKKAGEGRMEITAAEPPRSLEIQLEFIRPFPARNRIDFTLTPEGDRTRIVWGMQGRNNLGSKVMQAVINMDRLVGGDFDRGLANLKELAEGPVSGDAAARS